MSLSRPGFGSVFLGICILFALVAGCSLSEQTRQLHPADSLATHVGLDGESPWLKAHMPDGGLYLLSAWRVEEDRRLVHGRGAYLDARRDTLDSGDLTVSLDSVAVFESNIVQSSSAMGSLTVLTVLSLSMSVYCLANPKACFGSCPTFYADDASGASVLMAEGFSASVAPALEGRDLDALFGAAPLGRSFTVTMTNEALETHVVRHADLVAAPRAPSGRVVALDDGTWRHVGAIRPPDRCVGPEGDCTGAVEAYDGQERFSLADSTYLGTREVLELEFIDPPAGPSALVVASRHALLSTFLFYQGLAYLGENAVPALARLGDASADGELMGDLLGRIEVQLPDPEGGWRTVGEVGETGPLAVNVHALPLPPLDPVDPRVRLRLTKGNWRLDSVGLAPLGDAVTPVRIAPSAVLRDGLNDPDALADILSPERTLLSMPGDRFDLVYDLPDDADYELFMDSGGYYLEWMRTEWMAEEDPAMAAMMVFKPELALTYLAPKFKALEPDMEAHFWGSRYADR